MSPKATASHTISCCRQSPYPALFVLRCAQNDLRAVSLCLSISLSLCLSVSLSLYLSVSLSLCLSVSLSLSLSVSRSVLIFSSLSVSISLCLTLCLSSSLSLSLCRGRLPRQDLSLRLHPKPASGWVYSVPLPARPLASLWLSLCVCVCASHNAVTTSLRSASQLGSSEFSDLLEGYHDGRLCTRKTLSIPDHILHQRQLTNGR